MKATTADVTISLHLKTSQTTLKVYMTLQVLRLPNIFRKLSTDVFIDNLFIRKQNSILYYGGRKDQIHVSDCTSLL
jgi:hypothetical protein